MTQTKTVPGFALRFIALAWFVPAVTAAQSVDEAQPTEPTETLQAPPSAAPAPPSAPSTEPSPSAPPAPAASPHSNGSETADAMPMMMGGHHHSLWGDDRYRSPGFAFVLSLTPLPVDFGNLYAENLEWGIVYTSLELGLGTGMVVIGARHMCHSQSCDSWSDRETGLMIGFAAAYVAVKLVAGVHAGAAARSFNHAHAPTASIGVAPSSGGATLLWRGDL